MKKICSNKDCSHGGKPQELKKGFHKHHGGKDGHTGVCKTCVMARQKKTQKPPTMSKEQQQELIDKKIVSSRVLELREMYL